MAKIKWTKDPNEVLDFELDWLGTSGVPGPLFDDADTILTSTWIFPTGVVKDSDSIIDDDTATQVWISGGTEGQVYPLVNRVVTEGGRTHDRTAYLSIKTK